MRAQDGFKPYYKWIVLNTIKLLEVFKMRAQDGFKPYYKWIVLNTSCSYRQFRWLAKF